MTSHGGPVLALGSLCERCGCFELEHERHVDETWAWVPGRCLTCDCPAFIVNGQTVASFVYDADGG